MQNQQSLPLSGYSTSTRIQCAAAHRPNFNDESMVHRTPFEEPLFTLSDQGGLHKKDGI